MPALKNTINVTKFKKQCLSLLDNIPSDGLVITKHGEPVAKLIPYHSTSGYLIGSLKDKIEIKSSKDNLFSTGIKWDC